MYLGWHWLFLLDKSELRRSSSRLSRMPTNAEGTTANSNTEELSHSTDQYSLASSRTKSTDYGIYFRRMAHSQEMWSTEEPSLDQYSSAPSRTKSTDYDIDRRQMAYSEEMFESKSIIADVLEYYFSSWGRAIFQLFLRAFSLNAANATS